MNEGDIRNPTKYQLLIEWKIFYVMDIHFIRLFLVAVLKNKKFVKKQNVSMLT